LGQFPLLFDYWTESSIVIDYIAKQLGGYDKLSVRPGTIWLI